MLFVNVVDLYHDTLAGLDELHSPVNTSEDFVNYVCLEDGLCDVKLTRPSWKPSLKMTIQTRIPKVRMCDTELVNNLKLHLQVPTINLGQHPFMNVLLYTPTFKHT